MNRDFIVTKEHRRFTEFAGAIRKDVTIGICHGEAGVGKTQSARRYAHWDTLEPFIHAWGPRSEADLKHYAAAHRSRTVFYTPEVLAKHRDLMRDIEFYRGKVGVLIYEHLCAIGKITTTDVPRTIDFTELIIIDEAERLTPTSLELLRDLHDRHDVAGQRGHDEVVGDGLVRGDLAVGEVGTQDVTVDRDDERGREAEARAGEGRLATQPLPERSVALQSVLRHVATQRVRERAGIPGVAHRRRPTLRVVAVQEERPADALDGRRELPP